LASHQPVKAAASPRSNFKGASYHAASFYLPRKLCPTGPTGDRNIADGLDYAEKRMWQKKPLTRLSFFLIEGLTSRTLFPAFTATAQQVLKLDIVANLAFQIRVLYADSVLLLFARVPSAEGPF
jgi:hypothetical protein